MANGFLTTCSHGGISEATTGTEIVLDFSSITTGKGIQMDLDALTTGTGLEIRVDSDIVTTGKAINVLSGASMATSVFSVDEDGDIATAGALGITHTILGASSPGFGLVMTTALATGDVEGMVLTLTNTIDGINNFRAFTSDLTMAADCAGPYAGYFRTDVVDYTVTGLSAALGMELILSSVSGANGEAHGMTIDIACPDATSAAGTGTNKHSFIKMEIWGNATAKNNFDDQFNLFFLNGLTAGSGSLISAGTQTLRFNISGTSYYIPVSTTTNCLTFNASVTDHIVLSGAASDNAIEITGVAQGAGILIDYTIPTATSYALHIDCDTALSTGDVECAVIAYTNSAAGINNLRAFTVDLTMAAQCAGPYAGYFRTDMTGYQVTGLGSALGLELILGGITHASGEFHGMTIDIACPQNTAGLGSGSGKHSFIKMEIWGDTTAKNLFDDGFNLFYINNCTAGANSLFTTDATGTCQIEAGLRIYIDDTPYWIALMDKYDGA